MILEDACLVLRSKRLCDLLTLLRRQNNSAKVLIHSLVVVKKARILRQDIDFPAEDRPSFPIQGMAMRSSLYFWAGSMDTMVGSQLGYFSKDRRGPRAGHSRRMDVEASLIDGKLCAMLGHKTVRTDKDKVRYGYAREVNTEWVHPVVIW